MYADYCPANNSSAKKQIVNTNKHRGKRTAAMVHADHERRIESDYERGRGTYRRIKGKVRRDRVSPR